MSTPFLNLVVLRAPDIEEAQRFYSLLGLSFIKHSHGTGPTHYASDTGIQVFEIYPQTDPADSTKGTRIGFKIKNLDAILAKLLSGGAQIVSPARESPWGRRAVITDPIGHKLELIEDTSPMPNKVDRT